MDYSPEEQKNNGAQNYFHRVILSTSDCPRHSENQQCQKGQDKKNGFFHGVTF
jgi:hypothetical protein